MKYLYIPILIAIVLQPRVVAQSYSQLGPEVVVPWTMSYYAGQGGGNLEFIDSLTGLTYNRNTGRFAITSDGGEVWLDRINPPQFSQVNSMFILSKDTLVAVRDSQYFFHSYDGGLSWSHQGSVGGNETFSNCLFFNHKYGIIFTKEGGIRLSSDLGVNWTDRPWNFGPVKKKPFYSNGYLIVIEGSSTTGNGFVVSTDNGITWEKVRVSTQAVEKVTRIGDGYFICTSDYRCHKISSTGALLASLQSPSATYYSDYTYVSDDEIWCLDGNLWTGDNTRGMTRLSFNNTTSVRHKIDIMSNYASKVTATTFDKVYISDVIGSVGPIAFHKYNNSRIKIEYLPLPGNAVAECLYFVNDAVGFAATSTGEMLKTTDGGLTWRKTGTPKFYTGITCFAERRENEYTAAGNGGLVLQTTDGGESWQQIVTGITGNIQSVSYSGPDKIFFTTADSLYFTGNNWNQVQRVPLVLNPGRFQEMRFSDAMNGAAVWHLADYPPYSCLLTTTDGGSTWGTKNLTHTLLTYDPATFGIYFHPSAGPSVIDSSGESCIMSINGYNYKAHQNESGNGIFVNSLGSVILNLSDRYNWQLVRLGETPTITSLFAASSRAAFLATNTGRIIKISRSDRPKTPSSVLRDSPREGARFVIKNAELKWSEPYSYTPVTGYHVRVAMGDTSNIIIDDSSVTSTVYTAVLSSDTTRYFWRVRGKNINGWGEFNKWIEFRTTTEVLSFTTARPHASLGMTAAIKTPGGRYLVGAANGTIFHASASAGPWSVTNQIAVKPVTKFYINPSNSMVFALNGSDEYFYSGNQGVNWTRKPKAINGNIINSIAFYGDRTGFIAGSGGTIFKTTDGGDSWTGVRFAPNTADNLVIKVVDSSIAIAVGRMGSFTISTDGGNTFKDRSLAYPETLTRFEVDEGKRLILRNKNGERRVSTDLGLTWVYETLDLDGRLLDFADRGGNSVIIDSIGGVYTKLATAGDYYLQKLPGGGIGTNLEITNDEVLITGKNGQLFMAKLNSGSSGSTWQYVSNSAAASLNSYISSGAKSFVGAGAGGRVMISDDQGRMWRSVSVPVTTDLFTLTRKDDDEVVIAGASGTVLIVKNGTFVASGLGIDTGKSCTSVSFSDKYTGFITCSDGSFYRSTDGGRNWLTGSLPASGYGALKVKSVTAGREKIYFYLESTGNGTESTASELREYSPGFTNYRLIHSGTGTAKGQVLVSPGRFFALLEGNKIKGGRGPALDSLFEIPGDTIGIESFFTSGGRNFWVGNSKGDLYIFDGTGKITSAMPGFADGSIKSILFSWSGAGIVTSTAGNIYYGNSSVEVRQPDNPVSPPSDYVLYQNYPNPFNSSTVIRFDVPATGTYRLEFFNITGELVATLLDSQLESGRYSIRFDATSLAGGVYFYRLTGNGNAVTKKMIYLK